MSLSVSFHICKMGGLAQNTAVRIKSKNVGETLTENNACLIVNMCSVTDLFIDAGALHTVLISCHPFLYLIPICP